jgi:peroxiredoxin
MRLLPGAAAPDFSATTVDGSTLTLSALRGRPVWLCFHRYASCPLCNVNIHKIAGAWPRLRDQIQVVAVFQSPRKSVERSVGRQKPPFPLVCDPDERLYALYGLESSVAGYISLRNFPGYGESMIRHRFMPGRMEGTKTRLPADFLVDANGVIQLAAYSSIISEHLPVAEVERHLSRPAPTREHP